MALAITRKITTSKSIIMKFKKEEYKRALSLFTADYHPFAKWMTIPFVFTEDKNGATNGHSLVITPKVGEGPNKTAKILNVYPLDDNKSLEIASDWFKQAIEKAQVDVFLTDDDDCGACDGFGDVDFVFVYDGKDYTDEQDCPVCEGLGKTEIETDKPSGKKKTDYDQCVKIIDSLVSVKIIEKIHKVLSITESKFIKLVHQKGPREALIFRIKDIDIMCMPLYASEHEPVMTLTETVNPQTT